MKAGRLCSPNRADPRRTAGAKPPESKAQQELLENVELLLAGKIQSVFEDFLEYAITKRQEDPVNQAKAFFEAYASKADSDDFARKTRDGPEDGPNEAETVRLLDPLLKYLAESVCRLSEEERAAKGFTVAGFCAQECHRLMESGEMEKVVARTAAAVVVPLHVNA